MYLVQAIIHLSHGLLEWSPVTLASSSFPYSPFSIQKREGSFKTHISDYVTALLKTTGRLTIKGNAACEVRMYQALPTTPISLWPPYSWNSPNPSMFSCNTQCLVLLHTQASFSSTAIS